MESRSAAKKAAFKLLFGASTFLDSPLKRALRRRYPTVVSLIDSFKSYCTVIEKQKYYEDKYKYRKINNQKGYLQTGYKKFSIMLQQFESYIFIDMMLKPLLLDGYELISMHDSIVFADDTIEYNVKCGLDDSLIFGYTI